MKIVGATGMNIVGATDHENYGRHRFGRLVDVRVGVT